MTHAAGRWVRVDDGELFRCVCGLVKDGATRGPKGGRQWKWRLRDETEVCGPDCRSLEDHAIDEMDGSARAAWEEEQGETIYGPDERDWP